MWFWSDKAKNLMYNIRYNVMYCNIKNLLDITLDTILNIILDIISNRIFFSRCNLQIIIWGIATGIN